MKPTEHTLKAPTTSSVDEAQVDSSDLQTSKPEVGLNCYHCSRTGINHEKNEDSYRYSEDNRFFAVADGVGGGSRGDIASKALVDYLLEQTLEAQQDNQSISDDTIVEMVKNSDKIVKDAINRECGEGKRGASTLVSAWLTPNADGSYKVKYTCVGDARIYLLQKKINNKQEEFLEIRQITRDQTYKNMGMEGKTPANGSADDPVRMIGVGAVGEPSVQEETLGANQGLLLCTDGLHKFMDDKEIMQVCVDYLTDTHLDTKKICEELVSQAKKNNSHDDVTAVLVWLQPDAEGKLKTNDVKINNLPEQEPSSDIIKTDSYTTNQDESTTTKLNASLKNLAIVGVVAFAVAWVIMMAFVGGGKEKSDTETVNTSPEKINNKDDDQKATAETKDKEQKQAETNTTQTSDEELEKFQDNNHKFGYKNAQGVVFNATYDFATDFLHSVAMVSKGKKWYFINKNEEVVSNQYDSINTTDKPNLYIVQNSNKFGVISKVEDGTIAEILAPKYNNIILNATTNQILVENNGNNIGIDRIDNLLNNKSIDFEYISEEFKYISEEIERSIYSVEKGKKKGLLIILPNTDSFQVIEPKFDILKPNGNSILATINITEHNSQHQQFFLLFIDGTEQPLPYLNVHSYSEGFYVVDDDQGKCGYITDTGQPFSQTDYNQCGKVTDGIAKTDSKTISMIGNGFISSDRKKSNTSVQPNTIVKDD